MIKKKVVLVLICLILAFQGLSCSQNTESVIETNQETNISITPEAGESITTGVVLESVSSKVITTTQAGFNPVSGIRVNPGDICLEISGTFSNTTDDALQISYYAEGYNADGHQIAWTLDSGPVQGIKALDIPEHSGNTFDIRINMAEGIVLIKLFASSYTGETPLP
jgi:hypothetical protein